MKIVKAKPSEYDNIQRFLEDVFGHAFNYFPLFYPKAWKKEYTGFKNIFLMKDKDGITALVRIFPLATVQNGININLAGIGGVSTAYRCRGRGYMTELLNLSFAEMKRQKFPLSVLGGDRHRYGNFGYENGGRVADAVISARSLQKAGIKPVGAERYKGHDKNNLTEMIKAYNARAYRTKRSADEFDEAFRRLGIAVYSAGKGNSFGYIAVNATETREQGGVKKVLEFAGNSETILRILAHLSGRFGFPAYSLSFPGFCEISEKMLALSSEWNEGSGMMIKIISLKDTLEQFSKQKDFLFPEGEEITFTLRNGESAVMNKRGGNVTVNNGRGKNELVLSETEMVRLLFGVSFRAPCGTNLRIVQILKQFLPFNLYLDWLDWI
ncbi:MAG: GNAT family N-acetyltransferase [Candidatus Omnitrophica bacterium]|nr:GNAT family N-acetyltransferase [Candidatus Omnitrophota bacterium]